MRLNGVGDLLPVLSFEGTAVVLNNYYTCGMIRTLDSTS